MGSVISFIIIGLSVTIIVCELAYVIKSHKYEIKKTFIFFFLIAYVFLAILALLIVIEKKEFNWEDFISSISFTSKILRLDVTIEFMDKIREVRLNGFPAGFVALFTLYLVTIVTYFNLTILIFGYAVRNFFKNKRVLKQNNVQLIIGLTEESKTYIDSLISDAETSNKNKSNLWGTVVVLKRDPEKKYKDDIKYLFNKRIPYLLLKEDDYSKMDFEKISSKYGISFYQSGSNSAYFDDMPSLMEESKKEFLEKKTTKDSNYQLTIEDMNEICKEANTKYLKKHIDELKKFECNKKRDVYIISFIENDDEQFNFVVACKDFLRNHGVLLKSDKDSDLCSNDRELHYTNCRFILVCNNNQIGLINSLNFAEFKTKQFNVKESKEADTSSKFVYDVEGYFSELLDETRGFIRTFNKYEMLSYNFIKEHNFAKYLQELNLIHDNLTIDENVDINLFMFGLGKVNEVLLRDILIQNQFVTTIDGRLEPVRINVNVYDIKETFDSMMLSTGFLSYRKANFNQENYLPLPEDYNINLHMNCSIGNVGIINEIYDQINDKIKNNRKQICFYVIAMGSDYHNLSFYEKLSEMFKNFSQKMVHSYYFVRSKNISNVDYKTDKDTYLFGNMKKILSFNNVVCDEIFESAKKEHSVYLGNKEDNDIALHINWSKLSYIKKKSNLYSIASLQFKLALMGYDMDLLPYHPKGDSTSSFVESYVANHKILKDKNDDEYIEYKFTDNYIKNINELSKRDILRFIEHERWMAFELSMGVLPMKNQMFYELNKDNKTSSLKTKTPNEMYHYNITTMAGLIKYYNDTKKDVILYDDDLMDNFCLSLMKIS